MIITFQTLTGKMLYVTYCVDGLPQPSELQENNYALHDGRFYQCQNVNDGYYWNDVTDVIGIDARQAAITGIDCKYKTKRARCIVWEAPSWSSSIIGNIAFAGTTVDVIAAEKRWCRIHTEELDGWVLASDLEVAG